ncbi:MAG: protein translocase subunit SecF [Hyphomicrobiales bacterium]|nr:protein translocase subunit SecF [Hyphomicrobiales bacterium]
MPIKLIPDNTTIHFLGFKWPALLLSIVAIIFTVFLLNTRGLNFGIDFTGGIVLEVRTPETAPLDTIRNLLRSEIEGDIALQNIGSNRDVLIRLQAASKDASQSETVAKVKALLEQHISPDIEYRKVDYVGPQVGHELIQAGAMSLILAIAGMMIYIWMRFEWHFGVGAIMALAHDAVVTLGFFSITGIEFNLASIAAILTVIGYSVNDSVVIYDRIRENLRKFKKMPLEELLNLSINSTLSRTLLTAGSTLVALLALVLFGGEVIRGFSLAVFFGIVVGTYSSIYISAPILIFMNLRRGTGTVNA